MLKKRLIAFAIITDLIILDQLMKWLVLEHIFQPKLGGTPLGFMDWITSEFRLPFVSTEILPFFNLTMVWNQGISFGLFQNDNPWPLIIMALLIVVIFSVWIFRTNKWVEIIALSMVVGGAIGNIIDRLHFGAVADFLDFHIAGWHYPAFNVADSCITLGILLLVTYSLFFDKSNKENAHHETV
jgi:signal peptidase II